jgi:hypothetical protein
MSQENSNEMKPEYDMRGGVRGKYLERYQRRNGITSAIGAITVSSPTSGSDTSAKIVVVSHYATHISPPVAPEVSAPAGHAG